MSAPDVGDLSTFEASRRSYGCLSAFPQIQGTYDDPGISQFRLLWATSIARANRARISKIDRHHSRLFMRLTPQRSVAAEHTQP